MNPASLQIVQPSESFNQPASISVPVSNEDDTVEPAGPSQGGNQIICDKSNVVPVAQSFLMFFPLVRVVIQNRETCISYPIA